MNAYVWSASNVNFYPISIKQNYINAGVDLSDAVEISDETVNQYLGQLPDGKMLGVMDNQPSWVDAPEPTEGEVIALSEQKRARLRSVADSEIAWRQDAVDADIATEEETAVLAAWKKYRVLLMRVDTAAPVWPVIPA